ncbi:23S rRNA (adenine(2030)-N(6))-methyltransferase RlmJ [Variovorax terrae]|uniref:Ribosomal RNA large subunit methyltransferase J n=1 Tax=Variovorax terrae TaxID=2923278 RepID=A0A9X1VTK0_9BURK|nr:23S rRNA (adenine(2030)-N(6))-methyltransferase RlmJ [Variovorax terrae]MCJ0761789.1 23S rRNA (adenine(2030)-N(6))-methyltransferase RlmJ [Variovorax terrae]
MFSYRHAFHAGNHADVLKHMTLIAVLRHMLQKDAALTVLDTHAGAGLYRLDGDYATKGAEAVDGVLKLFALAAGTPATPLSPLIQDYLALIAEFNKPGRLTVYPGSPFVAQRLLREEARDKLKLFELHPTDSKTLAANIAQLEAGRQVAVSREDGFEGLRPFLPPPSRRALVLMDPSYEIKSDYIKVSACIQECLVRFPTGAYMVWYPVIPRPEAHELPRRLKTLARQAGKPWLHAVLSIGQGPEMDRVTLPGEQAPRPGLTASGVFIINPPHTLKAGLAEALPQLKKLLGRDKRASFTLES